MMSLQTSARARSIAPPLFALIACLVFAFVAMSAGGCSAVESMSEPIAAAGNAVLDATQAPVTTAATASTGPFGGVVGTIVALAYAEARVRLNAWRRDKRKERGEDPIQLAGVYTPPATNPDDVKV